MRFINIIILFFIAVFCTTLSYKCANKAIEFYEDMSIPSVTFPFKNMFDDKGKKLNIILIAAPFREEKHEKQYEEYKKKGMNFSGISSYLDFPSKINNPYEDKFHEKRGHNYLNMVSSWLYCFRNPSREMTQSGLPLLQLAEADLKCTETYKPDPSIEKKYDFMYCCLKDNDKCHPGWQSYNRNWNLAKECLIIMCREFGLKGVLIGRENCDFTEHCLGIVEVIPFLKFDEFQKKMQECRFLFVPNISDASPRVITEAISYNIPVLVNYNILGGWNNVISGVTGELFTSDKDVSQAIQKIKNNYHNYSPREWLVQNRGKKNSGRVLAEFLKENYPNINKKMMKYATIAI
jgi:hypothetical protein